MIYVFLSVFAAFVSVYSAEQLGEMLPQEVELADQSRANWMSVRLNLVHELFCDMAASKAKHQGRLLHRVALEMRIAIKISRR